MSCVPKKADKLNLSVTHCRVVERTWQDVPYFSSFIAKSWLNDLEDIGQGQRLVHVTHLLMPVITCA